MIIFLRPLAFFESRTSKFVCNFALVILYDVYSLAKDFADSISLIHTIAAIGRLAHEDTSLLNYFSPDPEISEVRPGIELKVSSNHCSGNLCLSPLDLAPPKDH